MDLIRLKGDYAIYSHPIRGRKVYAVSYRGEYIDDELPDYQAAVNVAKEHEAAHPQEGEEQS